MGLTQKKFFSSMLLLKRMRQQASNLITNRHVCFKSILN